MVKHLWRAGLFSLALAGPSWVWGNSQFNRAPAFNLPAGDIAFMGCYWAPLPVIGDGQPSEAPAMPGNPNANSTLYQSGGVKVGVDSQALGQMVGDAIIGDEKPPAPADALLQANEAVVDKGSRLELPLAAVAYSTPYQNALLMHILNPAKWGYNPGLTKYCGIRPYILIGLIDYFDAYPSSVKIREKEKDQKLSYGGKRSILEKDTDVFAIKGNNHVVAMEFFLVSTADGTTVWQGNLINTGGKMAGYQGIAQGLVENALKNLARK